MFESGAKDNSSLFLKLVLRKSFLELNLIEKNVALDLFAGRGEIASRVYSDFQRLYLVEKDGGKFALLKERLKAHSGARVCRMDNLKFIAQELPRVFAGSDLNLVDFDAYGSPNRQVQAFFSNWRVRGRILVFATDGGYLARIRGRAFSPWLYLSGPDRGNGYFYDSVLARNYEQLIKGFWAQLARERNFKIELFKLIWKRGAQVAYYGVCIGSK